MLPAVATPEVELMRLEPMLVAAPSETVPDQVAAVLEELIKAPKELTVPTPESEPEPP